MVEKFMLFRQWWHTIFADWNAARLPSYFAWMIPDSQVPYVSGYVADAMLVIFGCMILSTLLTLVQFRKGKVRFMALVKLGSIPIAALGLLGLFFASNLFETVFMDLRVTAIEAVTEEIPGHWTEFSGHIQAAKICPEGFWYYIGDELTEVLGNGFALMLDVLVFPFLAVFAFGVHIIAGVLCLSPFIGLFIGECILFKFTAPIHFLADVGGAILLLLGIALAILGFSFYMVGVMLLIYLVGGVIIRPLLKIVEVTIEVDPYS